MVCYLFQQQVLRWYLLQPAFLSLCIFYMYVNHSCFINICFWIDHIFALSKLLSPHHWLGSFQCQCTIFSQINFGETYCLQSRLYMCMPLCVYTCVFMCVCLIEQKQEIEHVNLFQRGDKLIIKRLTIQKSCESKWSNLKI